MAVGLFFTLSRLTQGTEATVSSPEILKRMTSQGPALSHGKHMVTPVTSPKTHAPQNRRMIPFNISPL